MTIATDIIESNVANCNYDATYSTALSQVPSFTAISSCLIDHIVESNSLSPSEKLYYLVNDFYKQSLKSWNSQNSKKHSSRSYSSNKVKFSEVKFSATKIGSLLGFSRSKIFNIQRVLLVNKRNKKI